MANQGTANQCLTAGNSTGDTFISAGDFMIMINDAQSGSQWMLYARARNQEDADWEEVMQHPFGSSGYPLMSHTFIGASEAWEFRVRDKASATNTDPTAHAYWKTRKIVLFS